MNEASLSAQLRNLSRDYYQKRISFAEYRAQRKVLLDKIDEEVNGQYSTEAQTGNPGVLSIFMRTIEFFKKY